MDAAKWLKAKCFTALNRIRFFVFGHFPLDQNKIVFESEGDFSDNSQALYHYMEQNGLLSRYRVYWLVDNLDNFRNTSLRNTWFIPKNLCQPNVARTYHLLTAKYYIYDHCNLIEQIGKREGQIIVNLAHGTGFKRRKVTDAACSTFDVFCATGPFGVESSARFFDCNPNLARVWGYPRNDYLFEKDSGEMQRAIKEIIGIKNGERFALWMPTFRKSVSAELTDESIRNETGLPILSSVEMLIDFDERLGESNVRLALKIHHLQAELSVFSQQFNNIVFLCDSKLGSAGIQLYQVIKYAGFLITDYSSVHADFLLLDRPIIYTLDDYEQYRNSRGFWPNNPLPLMAGYHVNTYSSLTKAIAEIGRGVDKYQFARNKVFPLFHTSCDGESSRRVLEGVGLETKI